MSLVATANPTPASKLPGRPRGRPKSEDAVALNNHILAVAREEFFDLGLAGAKMNIIAQRAKISTETLYARYRDKRELFEAVMQCTIDAWAEGAANNPVVVTTTLEETLRHYIGVQIRAMLSPEFISMTVLIASERKRFPDLQKSMLDKIPTRNKVVADRIREFAELENTPCRDPEEAVEALRGMVAGFVNTKLSMGEPFGADEQAKLTDRVVELFVHGRKAW